MMKNRILKTIFTVMITLSLIFAFTACNGNNNQALLDKISELEQKLEDNKTASDAAIATLKKQLEDADVSQLATLQAKITLLETANTQYKDQIKALETANTANEEAVKKLQTDLNTLTDSVANATHIERVVLLPKDINPSNPLANDASVDVDDVPDYSTKTILHCSLLDSIISYYPYQLVAFNVTLHTGNAELEYNICAIAGGKESILVSHHTDIEYSSDQTAEINYLVLYRFI